MVRVQLGLVLVLALCAVTVRAADDDAAWKAQVQAELKALREQNAALQKRVDASESRGKEIKMGADVQKAIESAVAKAGTGAKYGGKAYLDYDRPDIKGTGLVFTGELLYFKPVQSGQEYALLRSATGGTNTHVGKVKEVELDWEAGFRLGLGYRLPYDGWDVGASYTYFRSDATSTTTAAPGSGLVAAVLPAPDLGSAAEFVDLARANLELKLDSVDVLFGRSYKPSETTSVKLYGGFTGSWIEDELSVSYFNLNGATPTTAGYGYEWREKIDFTGYGIKVGASGDWKLKYGLSLFGRAEAALLSGSFDIRHYEALDLNNNRIAESGEIQHDSKQTTNRLVPEVVLAAGVAWNHKLNDRLNLKVSAGYEMTNYFNFISRSGRTDDVADASARFDNSGNLGLHGFVFKIKLDF